jgi:hypothetical protein
MASTYYPAAYGGPNLDFSGITQAAGGIAGGLSNMWQNQAVSSAIDGAKKPDGTFDFEKAIMNLNRVGATKEANVLANYAESQEMAKYRNATLTSNSEPDEVKLLRWWQQNGGGGSGPEPMRASEPQPSGVPGMSLQNAPAFIQDKLMPAGEKKRVEAEGTKQGERNAQKATLSEVAPGMQKLINQLVVNAKEADDGTFQNALGPLQGAAEAETWQGALGQFFPQTAGSVVNYLDKGRKEGFVDWKTGNVKGPGELSGGYTHTLRSKINATSAALISVLQRAQRVPGIGAQSDYELRQIVNQVGELNKSRTKEDFYDRLSNVVSNFNNLGIPVEMPTADEIAGAKPTDAAVQNYAQPQQQEEAGAVPYDAAEEAPPAVRGSAVDTGSGIPGRGAPPLPATGDKNKLIYLMNNAPPEIVKQKMEEFDKLYNWPGLASIVLGQSRAGR